MAALLLSRMTEVPHAGAPRVGGGEESAPGVAIEPGVSFQPTGRSHAGPAASVGAPSSSVLAAAYRTQSTWIGGYEGLVTISNPGQVPVSGWNVRITLPLLGLKVSSADGATYRQEGKTVLFTPTDGTRVVSGDKAVQFTFKVAGVGTPSGCDINGRACEPVSG
jgi:hypothetical protein